MTSCDIIASFRKRKSQPHYQKEIKGIVNNVCGCMLSKWTSVEFQNITCNGSEYLHVACVYMEPFSHFDYYNFTIQLENAPQNLLKLYEYAKQHTAYRSDDTDTEVIVPYVYKKSKTILKRCKKDALFAPSTPSCIYFAEPNDIDFVNRVFECTYQ
jgi:hypothetical protein